MFRHEHVILKASAVGAGIALLVALVAMIGAPGANRDVRTAATLRLHRQAQQTDEQVYLADPLLRIVGTVHAPALRGGEVLVVERRTLAQSLSDPQSATDGRFRLPFDVPVAVRAKVGVRGDYEVSDTPVGNYSVFVRAPGYQPARQDNVLVRDTVGGSASFAMRAAATTEVDVPDVAGLTQVVPVYSGHWPEERALPLRGSVATIESRHPDGWPVALVCQQQDGAQWYRVTVDAQGHVALDAVAPRDLVLESKMGAVARAGSPLHVIGEYLRAKDAAGIANATTRSRLRLRSRLPFGAFELTDGDVVATAFADRSGSVMFDLDAPGPVLVRAQIEGGHLSLPRGAMLLENETVELTMPLTDAWNARMPLFEPRLAPPEFRSVGGFVTDADGRALSGVTIGVYVDDSENTAARTGASRAHGFFRIDGIRPGAAYTIRCGRTAAYGDSLVELHAVPNPDGKFTRVDVQLTGTSWVVPVPSGEAGDLVLAFRPESTRPVARVHVTEDGGTVGLRDLEAATYRLVLERDAIPIAETTIAPSATAEAGSHVTGEWRSL